jgi:hypothetical protein
MAHPFSDGNGRFARLLVHAALARCAGLDLPVLALAALSGDGDWPAFNAVFFSVLRDAIALTRALRRLSG